jgi:hypothetical protein
MKSTLPGLLTVLQVVLVASAAEPAAKPTADQILDRYLEATGGRAALERLQTRIMKGRVEVTALGTDGAFEVRAKAPNKQVSQIAFEGFGSMREGYDGTVAWSAAPFQGVRVKEGGDLARVQRTTVFPRELKWKQVYQRLEVRGAEKVNGVDTWLVEGYPKTGKPDKLYFDQKSGLLVREESTVTSVVGELTFQVDLGDYREVDGVQVAFSIRMPKPAEVGFNIKIEEVKHNVAIPDAEFAKPAG